MKSRSYRGRMKLTKCRDNFRIGSGVIPCSHQWDYFVGEICSIWLLLLIYQEDRPTQTFENDGNLRTCVFWTFPWWMVRSYSSLPKDYATPSEIYEHAFRFHLDRVFFVRPWSSFYHLLVVGPSWPLCAMYIPSANRASITRSCVPKVFSEILHVHTQSFGLIM
jgi:hypothetical protein